MAAERTYPASEVGAAAERARLQQRRSSLEELHPPEARGGGQEERPHIQGVVAVQVTEGLQELSHVEGKEGRP